ncbi:MAG: phosphoenolpyruvate--protein phosphotransferase [Clostridia bacterium]|nr:phosphoenolpyruvate--protein phosphotransferase [Clostridium sp.]MEE0269738.1 phosphoenolpyruvate--protein phosphotransferase [Clostridia bacterium]
MVKGKGVSKGIGIGHTKVLKNEEVKLTDFKVDDKENELNYFRKCLNNVIEDTKKVIEKLSGTEADIMNAYLMILQDPTLTAETERLIQEEGYNAGYAAKVGFETVEEVFKNMDDEYMSARASDIEDMKQRVVNKIINKAEIDLSNLPENTVLVGKDLSTSDTAKLNLKTIAGIIIENGSENSHVSIMARTHEIPAIVGVKGALDSIPNDSDIAINGETGEIFINPSPEEISKLTKIKNELKDEKGNLAKFKNKKSITKDGYKTEVVANIGTPKDMDATIENGAEGVGLFRSEFLYMDSESMPTEEEQFEAYKEVLEKAEGKRVIVRTLDIGGDKDLKYLNLDKEDNPFLGYRAIRICLREPEIFKVQLRALYRASNYGKLAIMLPMISSVDEIRSAKDIINEVKEELKAENIKFDKNVKVGIMIEVPSAAIMAEQLATECDFFSIGTNDLIQYTVAVERGNEKISDLYTKFHPAVIRLIKMAIDGAHKSKIFCGMCGEAAADERFIPLLVGLGLDEFSMNPTKILNSRKMIRNLNHKECKKLVQEILRMSSASEIKARLEEYKDNL